MSLNVADSSISTELQAALAAWKTMFRERFYHYGRSYALDWMVRPVFDLAIAALIYAGGREELIPYVIVALAANSFLFSAIYWVGEILDRERLRGTLVSLFLAPCSRVSWMAGYAGAAVGETLIRTAIMLVAGYVLFGVTFDPNFTTLLVAFPLYLLSLTGIALVLSGIGLLIKRGNALSNLVSPFFLLLGGIYYPVAELPDTLRFVARALPVGYGMEALTAATLESASLGDIWSSVVPLAGFALVSPVIGYLAFNYLEHLVRRRGEVDLY
jgi:ABC-2 type transport system permease protein